jgi:NUMOD3 motif
MGRLTLQKTIVEETPKRNQCFYRRRRLGLSGSPQPERKGSCTRCLDQGIGVSPSRRRARWVTSCAMSSSLMRISTFLLALVGVAKMGEYSHGDRAVSTFGQCLALTFVGKSLPRSRFHPRAAQSLARPSAAFPSFYASQVQLNDEYRNSTTNEATRFPAAPSTKVRKETALRSLLLLSENDFPRLTERGGYTHTTASRAKISLANKGKEPWNKGRPRSPEEREKIAQGVRARNREKFLLRLNQLNITEEQYIQQQELAKQQCEAQKLARRTPNGGYRPTNETRQKISSILREKHAKGEISSRRSAVDPSRVRRGFTHSASTKEKIAASLRDRWANDTEYRSRMLAKTQAGTTTEETRRKISQSLVEKWQDPSFRVDMIQRMKKGAADSRSVGRNSDSTSDTGDDDSASRSESHRQRISAAVKAKWQDPEYRERALAGIAKRKAERAAMSPPSSVKGTSGSPRLTDKPDSSRNHARRSTSMVKNTAALPKPPPALDEPASTAAKESHERAHGTASMMLVSRKGRPPSAHSEKADSASGSIVEVLPLKEVSRPPRTGNALIASVMASTTSTNLKLSKDDEIASRATRRRGLKQSKSVPVTDSQDNSDSVEKLLAKRRDLDELLYGEGSQHDGTHNNEADDLILQVGARSFSSVFQLGDEDLDDFDPYGLENF